MLMNDPREHWPAASGDSCSLRLEGVYAVGMPSIAL